MLLNVFKRLAGFARPAAPAAAPDAALLARAEDLAERGERRAAIQKYKAYLESDPASVPALNGIGSCYADIGDLAQASAAFELAYQLDDTYLPAMVNHAKLLIEQNRAQEGLPFLERAKISKPGFRYTDAIYASWCLKSGQTARARSFQVKSMVAHFDNLRLTNCYLFWTAYDDVDEGLIAAEHKFWAGTMAPPVVDDVANSASPDAAPELDDPSPKRIRIGYWSPDFRRHSVNFFFRPLLEAHDRARFEIFLYYDFPAADAQTAQLQSRADEFHNVHEMPDAQLCAFMRAHRLDVLVELAGHSSNNRVNLLHHRMATVQLTALGYPLTTGLRNVDGKLLDRHASTDNDARYYTEAPVVLPGSFWCFDPMIEVPIGTAPPLLAKGHVTFGCIGNIAKITTTMTHAWVRILQTVAESRLTIRSISFEDPAAMRIFARTLHEAGLPMSRIDLLPPQSGLTFYSSYDDIDIILDTFPFNGGTTTCFAVFMGVPVVTLAGKSLLGRMGASVMNNMQAPELVAQTLDDYVRIAIELSGDPQRLVQFKRNARERLRASPLGNGELFAREFEQACEDLLTRRSLQATRADDRIKPLPASEMMWRAYESLRSGQSGPASRIVNYCLQEHPRSAAPHIFIAQQLALSGRIDDAINHLSGQLEAFDTRDRVSALVTIVRWHLQRGQPHAAKHALSSLHALRIDDMFDGLQVRLYAAALASAQARSPASFMATEPGPGRDIRVLIACDDIARFDAVVQQIHRDSPCPPGWRLSFERCDEAGRAQAWRAALAEGGDAVVFAHKDVELHSTSFWQDACQALASADIVGFWGADRWTRLDWREDDFTRKAGAYCSRATEGDAPLELLVVGEGVATLCPGQQVLGGSLLIVRPDPALADGWDAELVGCDTLMEEMWTHGRAKQGARLAVHRGLGVCIDAAWLLDDSNRVEARMRCARLLEIDPFATPRDDDTVLALPVATVADSVQIVHRYLEATP